MTQLTTKQATKLLRWASGETEGSAESGANTVAHALRPKSTKLGLLTLLLALLCVAPANAEEARVAVASNFVQPMRALSEAFSKRTHHRTVVISGATGKLYAQVKNGAPFDVLLAADEKTPRAIEDEGLAARGTRFTYAVGKLVLYSAQPNFVDAHGEVLRAKRFEHLAIANPKLAPYGSAAISVLKQLNLLQALEPKLALGENIAQTLQFVESGTAELGFVAWSQVLNAGKPRAGSFWVVPEHLYPAIRQDAVLLRKAEGNSAARAFIEFLKSDLARRLIAEAGYALPPKADT